MSKPISQLPVCVTGATGFIALHIVHQLLERGYKVRATVRTLGGDKVLIVWVLNLQNQQIEALKKLDSTNTKLELVKADLLQPGSFDKAVEGCEFVIHTASPVSFETKDPQKELVDPAVKGTLNVLESCQKSSTVKKVILTSSISAICDGPDSKKKYTEDDWNTVSSLDRNPYNYSKTQAETAAWKFVNKEGCKFKMITINVIIYKFYILICQAFISNRSFFHQRL